MRRRKKIALWIAGILLTPLVLLLLLVALFYMPPVQQWAVRKVAAYASEQTGMDISLERIRIKFPLDLDLQRLTATTPPDTILSVRHALVDLDLRQIFQRHIVVDALDLQDGVLDTRDLIATVRVKGRLGNLHIEADDIALRDQRAELTRLQLDQCDVDVALRDTTVIDTTESAPIPWSIGLGDIGARQTRVAFHSVGDSLTVRAGVKDLLIQGGDVNLGAGIYKVEHLKLDADSLIYDTYQPRSPEGLDYNYLALRPVSLDVENLFYQQEGNNLSLHILECSGSEQSGLQISSLKGHVRLNEANLEAPDLNLVTPHSQIDANVRLDWSALNRGEHGYMDIDLNASIGREDLLTVAGNFLTKEQRGLIPNDPITLSLAGHGNVDRMEVERGRIMVSPMVDAEFKGTLTNILDPEHLGADLDMNMQTFDLALLRRMTGLPPSVRLPQMRISGKAGMKGSTYTADLRLTQDRGVVLLRGSYDTRSEAYQANVDVRNLNLHNFLPYDSLYTLTAKAKISGQGTEFSSPRSRLKAEVEIGHLRYGQNNIDNTRLTADIRNGEGIINLYSNNDVLMADACANLRFDKKITNIDFNLGLNRIDLHALGITSKPMRIAMTTQIDGSTNLSDTHELSGSIKAIQLDVEEGTFYPTDIDLALLMAPDTMHAEVTSGDFVLYATSQEGIERIIDKANLFSTEFQRQLSVHSIDQDTLKSLLPKLNLRVKSGGENTMARIVKAMGYTFDRLSLDLDSDPMIGINGNGHLHALNTGAILLDTISWNIYQDSTNIVRLNARVKNGPRNKQVVFQSDLAAELTPTGANAAIQFFDGSGKKGLDLGTQIIIEDDGYRVRLHPLNPIIAYRNFSLNEDNYVLFHDDKRVEADVDLLADDGTGFKLYSTPNEDALQDITLSIHDFNVGELSTVLPYMPDVEGVLAGDFHIVQDEQSMSVLIDANVRDLAYEGVQMGNVGLNAVYLPNNDGTHYVDGIVSQNGSEVMLLSGTYNPEGEGNMDAQATLQRLPLALANGFIPNQMAELSGYVTGEVDVTGSISHPNLNGILVTDSMYLNSDMYSLHLRFPNDTIDIRQSNLRLNRIEAYSTGRNPLVLNGNINFQNTDRIALDLSISARNFELINAPKSQKAVAYGKVFVNVGTRLTGTLNNLVLRGRWDVLGDTDVTYVLTDSPLTVEDQLAELVTFVDFADTTTVETVKSSPQNIDMTINISIEQAAQVHCLLSNDGTNHIELEGGGDLTMTYTTQNGLKLYGRYTIVSGLMNYSLMVVALKNFAIQNGSYVEFTGEITNPKLNVSASERIKTTVYENNVPRSVNFDVGLTVSQTLENMGLEFTLEAPSDMSISNQLAAMSTEERGKVAVTMLATGMYLTESGNGMNGFSATNALNSFLQTQIAAISNKALSTIDLNFGVDNTSTATGATQTDYSFSFAKRFWGNRISLIIGGKVSSGSEAVNTGQSIINNISIEYRLDKSATRYVRLYYDRETESLLEGEVIEMGAGIVLRKKSTRLGELFLFRKPQTTVPYRNEERP